MPFFKNNHGTVMEHCVLSTLSSWIAGLVTDEDRILYIDTHAMAPVNSGEGGTAVNDLQGYLMHPPPPQSAGLKAYLAGVGQALAIHNANPAADWYPTHFIHAVRAIRAIGFGGNIQLKLCEICQQKKQSLNTFLDDGNLGNWCANLNPYQWLLHYNFANPAPWLHWNGWEAPKATIIFHDPYALTPGAENRQQKGYMGAADLDVAYRNGNRDFGAIIVQMAFCTHRENPAGCAAWANDVGGVWRGNLPARYILQRAFVIRHGDVLLFIGLAADAELKVLNDNAVADLVTGDLAAIGVAHDDLYHV